MPTVQNSATTLLTADGVVGTSGAATRVFFFHIISGGTAAVVSLRNGTTVTSTIYITETGTINTGRTLAYGANGILFPAGCFCDVDVNTTSVLVSYEQ